ncbi:serine/threonine-protein kinase [Chloroflexota bacterium]|nr:serine/threonine-protein kinase [Chloroflexota bacterium]
MDLQPETILHERYRVIEKLGQGGMGAVFLAWDQTLEMQVAIKSNFNPAPESVDQFLKEARLLAALRHQNLPRVIDYFVIDNEQFLVMDYIPGEDLGKRLKAEGAQKLDDVLRWSAQLSSALAYMHVQNPPVIHRDIKPANIKLTPDGEVILVDFGIAKAAAAQSQTATGAAGYTPGYAPPEQYGQGHTGPYSDQFSLAATVYALLTQAKPADSIARVLGKETLVPIRQMDPEIPQNIADAILKALALKPEDRFESVTAFQNALKDPNFSLLDAERQQISSVIAPTAVSEPTRVVSKPTDPTVMKGPEKSKQKKGKKIGWIIGIVGGLGVICLAAAALLLFVIPQSPIYLLDGGAAPTATETVQVAVSTEIMEALETEVVLAPTEAATEEPTATVTVTPTATEALEAVGGSGLIVFASDRGEGDTIQIWTMEVLRNPEGDVVTGVLTQLTFDEGDKDQPVWSPDGTQIAYVAPGGLNYGLDIWVMDSDGSNPMNITQHAGDELDPVWLPDGSRIAFTHHLRDAGNTPIYALTWIRPDGSGRERLSTDFVEWDPTFTPDGRFMIYVISASSHDYLYFRSAVDDFDSPRGLDLRALFGEFGEVSDPVWAPQGSQFAYVRHNGPNEVIVLVTYTQLEVNGLHQPKEYVLTDTNVDTDPVWSADAHWLAFTSERDGNLEIYLMPTTGRPQINLSRSPGVDRSPDWLPLP